MLRPKPISRFKKDLKKFQHKQYLLDALDEILNKLIKQQELEPKYCDHPLTGEWKGSRECHIKPDVLLVYRVDEKAKLLILERIGSHAELF